MRVFFVEQMGHAAKLLGCALERFDLFAELSLLRLFLTEYFVDILHG